jgi:hypothetical protein
LAETIALIIPTTKGHSDKSLTEYLQEIIALKNKSDSEKKEYLQENWLALNYYERFVFTKLITGSLRIGVSQKLMTRALSKAEDVDEDALAYKLMGNWDPNTITFQELILDEAQIIYQNPILFIWLIQLKEKSIVLEILKTGQLNTNGTESAHKQLLGTMSFISGQEARSWLPINIRSYSHFLVLFQTGQSLMQKFWFLQMVKSEPLMICKRESEGKLYQQACLKKCQ